MSGVFITFEGQEGAGKTTQAAMLYEYLKGQNYNVISTREPGSTAIAEKIRDILKDLANAAIVPAAEALLYIAARAQLVAEVIRPHLDSGGIVICDRFMDSTTAYQGFGNGLNTSSLEFISNFAAAGINPDITFLLAIDPAAGLARKATYADLDRIEVKSMEYHKAVARGYDFLAKAYPARIKALDATLPQDDIHKTIIKYVDALFM